MPSPNFSKIHRLLRDLGLSDLQISLYLTSLEHGILSVLALSKLTGISRPQIYEAAEKLISLGLYDITRKQRKKYIPASPAKLITLGKRNIEETNATLEQITGLLPTLESLAHGKKTSVTTRYYEGLRQIKEAYENELAEAKKSEVLSLVGSVEDMFEFFPEAYWDKWNKQFATQGSHSRMLVHYSKQAKETARLDKKYQRETRYLQNFPMKVNIDIFNNTVLIVSAHDELAIWIDSPILAASYRILFNTLWPQAKNF